MSDLQSALGSALLKAKAPVSTRLEQVTTSANSDRTGWVRALPKNHRDKSPRLFGLAVEGLDENQEMRARILVAGRNAPDWFHQEVLEASEHDSPKQFRVWVCNRHPGGVLAYVMPVTKTLRQLNVEWERRQEELAGKPMNWLECLDQEELVYFFYKQMCAVKKWHLHSVDVSKQTAIAITPHSMIHCLDGASKFIRAFYDSEDPAGRAGINTAEVLKKFGNTRRIFRL